MKGGASNSQAWGEEEVLYGHSAQTFGIVTRPKETPNLPSSALILLALTHRLRVLGKGKGPLTPPKPTLLAHDAFYAVK